MLRCGVFKSYAGTHLLFCNRFDGHFFSSPAFGSGVFNDKMQDDIFIMPSGEKIKNYEYSI